MIGIIGLAGGAASLMMGGATLAAGLATGAAGLGVNAATGTVRLAKDSIQALSPIGAGGSQARRRLMERGLIESGVNRTKQLKKMTGKAAGLLGVNVSLASILKQSQIFTGVFGTVFQILGAFVDIMLIPLMPVIKWVLNNMIDFIPNVQAASSKMTKFGERVQRYLEELFKDGRGLWGKDGILYKLAADAGTAIKNWWLDIAWPNISDFWTTTIWPEITKWTEAILIRAGLLDPSTMTEADELVGRMVKEFAKQGMRVPKMPMGGGSATEFEDLGEVPEGYGGVPSIGVIPSRGPSTGIPQAIDFLQTAEENIQRGFGSLGGTFTPGFRSPITRKEGGFLGLGLQSPFPDPLRELERGIEQEMGANFFAQAGKNILGAIGIAQTPPLPGAGRVLGIGANEYAGNSNGTFFSSTENLPLFATVRSPAEFRNMNTANNAIDLTNQSKDNYVARYHDEAAQYEDELYFQEMMLGVGRY